jgi:hypothetical protein
MNQKGLGRFGITARTVLREHTSDHDDLLVCPECGTPIGGSLQGHEVAHPEVVSEHEPASDDDTLVVHGWKCDHHSGYSVVCPTPVGSRDAAEVVNPGWVGVQVRMADGFVRTVAVPAKEVRETGETAASGTEEVGSA